GQPFDLAHQRGEAAATFRVAIVVDVLTQQHDLARAVTDRAPALGQHVLHRHVTLAAPHARDDAEGAVVVAALDDAYEMAHARPAGLGEGLAQRPVVARLQARDEAVV